MSATVREPRTDRCPGALALHEAADGFLARVRLPGGRITGPQMRGLAAIADELGVGLLELTSRANVQIRGLAADSDVAERVADLGLLPSASHERVRNIVAGPDEAHDETVRDLDEQLQQRPRLADLPGRFLFAVGPADDADITLAAGKVIAQGRMVDGGVRQALDLAEVFQRVRGDAWRMHEVPTILGGDPAITLPPAAFPGGALAPLGRLTSQQARALGAYERLVITTARTVVVRGDHDLASTGLITDPTSGWHGVTACTGMPGCAKARADVQAQARVYVEANPVHPRVHFSGCERRCGAPRADHLEVVA